MNKRNLIASLVIFFAPIVLWGQSVVGTVTSVDDKPLAGANVVVVGTDLGTATDDMGTYHVDLSPGDYELTASVIGYSSSTQRVEVGEDNVSVNFVLEVDAITLSALEVLASRAGEKTPVAYTTVSKLIWKYVLVHKIFQWL